MPRLFSILGASLTRPANTIVYAAGDAISDNATANLVQPLPVTIADINDAPFSLAEIELDTDDNGLAAGTQIDVYVYATDPTLSGGVGGGDNAAFANARSGFRARFRGTFLPFAAGGKATCRPVDGDNEKMPLALLLPATGTRLNWLQYRTVTGFSPSSGGTKITPRLKGFNGRV